jgi:hypothetical protein
MLREHTNLWLFRCNQRSFCGDFAVVTMSARSPARRGCWAIELKQRSGLRLCRGTPMQLANHRAAVAEIARLTGIITSETEVRVMVGDPDSVRAFYRSLSRGAPRRGCRGRPCSAAFTS